MTLVGSAATRTQAGFLLQTGKSLSGQLFLSSECSGVGVAQGRVAGTSVAIAVNQTAQTVNLTGSPSSDGSSISGHYSILSSGCGSSDVGTWSATRVKTLQGNFQGTFTSGVTGVPVSNFTGSLAQGVNTGSTSANLSGTTSSTNSPCFTNASISGLISGTSVVLNFVTSEGIALGQFRGASTTDATTVSGTYDFFNAQAQPLSCPGGDFGTAVLTVQASM